MKFSYTLLKKLVPAVKSPQQMADILTMHLFEVESVAGDTLEVKVLPNRYSDAASHWGIARVVGAVLGRKATSDKRQATSFGKPKASSKVFSVKVQDKNLCPRYSGRYFEIQKVGESPVWMKKILESCGVRPINAVVDIMNYVMLEVGQPLHAFDAGHVANREIIVRGAKKDEWIKALDGKTVTLALGDLVIADEDGPLAIAGIKGGARAEVGPATKAIIVESANFDPVSIYKTSRRLGITTDASLRFSHGMSPALVPQGILRATELLTEICGATAGDWIDVMNAKPPKIVLKFDAEQFRALTGLSLPEKTCLDYLRRLGFEVRGKLVSPPAERTDIAIFEDLAEEIMNLHGYDRVPVTPPHIPLRAPADETAVHFKERVRKILTGLGLSEVYNYSFAPQGEVEIKNPIAEDKKFLRANLGDGLLENVRDNARFMEAARIFEIGKIFLRAPVPLSGTVRDFASAGERLSIGIAIGFKKAPAVFEMKGVTEAFLNRLGIEGAMMTPVEHGMIKVESENEEMIGRITLHKADFWNIAVAELEAETLLRLLAPDKEFRPSPKYPAVVRDISVVVDRKVRTGDMLSAIEEASGGLLPDGAEVIDFYEDPKLGTGKQSLTFRLAFRSEARTLTDKEVNEEIKKITALLQNRFGAEIR